MGKMKTKKAAAKRIKVTASGKYFHEKAFGRHKRTSKTAKRKRQLRKTKELSPQDSKLAKKMLPND